MTSLVQRQQGRFDRMQATTAAAIAATFEAARRTADPRASARLAGTAWRMQTCHRSTAFVVHRPEDDAPWTAIRCPMACMCRWCVPCERNRARLLRRHVNALLDTIWVDHPLMRTSMLTLSSRNRPLSDASAMLEDHLAALARYRRTREVARSHYGSLDAIEIAVRGEGREVGVHSHHLQLVDDAALGPGRYLDIQRIRAIWARCLRVDYVPICDIRAAKTQSDASPDDDLREAVRSSVREAAKYCLKPVSLLSAPPRDLFGTAYPGTLYIHPDVILHVGPALRGRRLVRLSGLWKTAHAKLLAMGSEQDGEFRGEVPSDLIPTA